MENEIQVSNRKFCNVESIQGCEHLSQLASEIEKKFILKNHTCTKDENHQGLHECGCGFEWAVAKPIPTSTRNDIVRLLASEGVIMRVSSVDELTEDNIISALTMVVKNFQKERSKWTGKYQEYEDTQKQFYMAAQRAFITITRDDAGKIKMISSVIDPRAWLRGKTWTEQEATELINLIKSGIEVSPSKV